MDYSAFSTQKHPTPPTGRQLDDLRKKYYPEMAPVVDPKLADQPVTLSQIDDFAWGSQGKAAEEFGAVADHSWRALIKYVTGVGSEVVKYENMLNELASASGDQPTTHEADHKANVMKVMNQIGLGGAWDYLELQSVIEAGEKLHTVDQALVDRLSKLLWGGSPPEEAK